MPPHRLEKINELIKQELGKILHLEGDFEPGVLATILAVKTASDLRNATITFSVWPNAKGKEILKIINKRLPYFQQLLIKKLRLHPVPKISFNLDETEATSQEIDTLINRLKNDDHAD